VVSLYKCCDSIHSMPPEECDMVSHEQRVSNWQDLVSALQYTDGRGFLTHKVMHV
jgi:hypothetical protein